MISRTRIEQEVDEAAKIASIKRGLRSKAPVGLKELRMCIADLRDALSESLKGGKFDAAQLLNDTMETAQKFRCYRDTNAPR